MPLLIIELVETVAGAGVAGVGNKHEYFLDRVRP